MSDPNKFVEQLAMIWQAPRPHLVAIVGMAILIFGIAELRFRDRLDTKDTTIAFQKEQLASFQKIGATPAELQKRMDAVEERLRGRLLTDDAKTKFIAALKRAEASKSPVTVVVTCEECMDYAEQLIAAVKDAGWSATLASSLGYVPVKGLKLSWTDRGPRKPSTTAFGDAMAAAGLQYETLNSDAFNQPALWIGRR